MDRLRTCRRGGQTENLRTGSDEGSGVVRLRTYRQGATEGQGWSGGEPTDRERRRVRGGQTENLLTGSGGGSGVARLRTCGAKEWTGGMSD